MGKLVSLNLSRFIGAIPRTVLIEESAKSQIPPDYAHRSLILETGSEIWKFSLRKDNDVEV